MSYKSPFWVRFDGHKAACVEDETESAAKAQAAKITGCEVIDIQRLPYPAEPRISAEKGSCPAFCFSPTTCAGRGSCPKSYACSE